MWAVEALQDWCGLWTRLVWTKERSGPFVFDNKNNPGTDTVTSDCVLCI